MYFSDGCSHTYEYRLPVNFAHLSSFCAGHVFIQPVRSKLLVNSTDIIYKKFELMLTRRAKACSSSSSQTVSLSPAFSLQFILEFCAAAEDHKN